MLSVIIVAVSTCLLVGQETPKPVYHDENGYVISKKMYDRKDRKISPPYYLSYWDDSSNYYLMLYEEREVKGSITNADEVYNAVDDIIDDQEYRYKPLVIVYYPGLDRNNAGGTSNKDWLQMWHLQLESGLREIEDVNLIYLARTLDSGLDRYKGILSWHLDPNEVVTNTFFTYHYPGKSYVVLRPNGNYAKYLGEFPKEYVWKGLEDTK